MILMLSLLQPNKKPSIPVLINVDNVTEIYEQFDEKGKFHHTNIVFNAMGHDQPLFTSVEERLDSILSSVASKREFANVSYLEMNTKRAVDEQK